MRVAAIGDRRPRPRRADLPCLSLATPHGRNRRAKRKVIPFDHGEVKPMSDAAGGGDGQAPAPPRDPARLRFRPTRTTRTYDAVVTQVRGAIATGRLRPGDRLPSALELAREFEISRNAVLEALRVLERSGLI